MVILLKIIAIALVTVFASMIVKQLKPEIAVFITLVGSVLIITMAIDSLTDIVNYFTNLFRTTGVNTELLTPLFKIIAIGYLAEFSANICSDAGAASVADKILFAAKLIILVVSLPIITSVIDMIVALL